MRNTVPIKDSDELIRDVDNNAVLNNNNTALENYKIQRKLKRDETKRIENLEQDVIEIKQMLKALLER